jgi:hypothetical protein
MRGEIGVLDINFNVFNFFDYERSWWRLFQKRVVRVKVDIYVFMDSKLLAIWEIKLYTSNNIKTTNMSKSNVYQVYLSCRLYAKVIYNITIGHNLEEKNCSFIVILHFTVTVGTSIMKITRTRNWVWSCI